MGPPDPMTWALAALMLAVSGYHVVRLTIRYGHRARALDFTHLAMGVAMAAMLAGRMAAPEARLLAIGFVVPTVWFAARTVHAYVMAGPRAVAAPLGPLIGAASMVYMLAVAAAGHPTAGMAMPTAPPVLTGLLIAALLAACVPRLSRPSIGAACQIAMSTTAAYMLLAI